jgi:hypothetical protein
MFAFAPHPTCTGWARDGRPRAPRFVFLFFSSPLPFRFLFHFFFHFSRFFLVSLVRFADHSSPSGSSHIRPFVPVPRHVCLPLVRLARWQRMGPLAPPSFALVRPARWRRRGLPLLPPLVGFSLSFLGFVFFFSFFSCSCFFHRFALMVMHLVAKKSRSSNDPLVQTTPTT